MNHNSWNFNGQKLSHRNFSEQWPICPSLGCATESNDQKSDGIIEIDAEKYSLGSVLLIKECYEYEMGYKKKQNK